MSIRRHKVLLDTGQPADQTTGDWIAMDVRYDPTSERGLQGVIAAGDTVTIQVTTRDTKGTDKSFLTTLGAEDISTFGVYTTDFNVSLPSGYTYIRAVKSGTAGVAKVQGMI